MGKLSIEIISVRRSLFKGEVETLVVPGTKGAFKVMPRHIPILSTLTKGDIIYTVADKEYRLPIEYGFVELADDNMIICIREQSITDMVKEGTVKEEREADGK